MKRKNRKVFKEAGTGLGDLNEALEKTKASIHAFVEHPVRIIKCQLGLCKTRYRRLLQKNNINYCLGILDHYKSIQSPEVFRPKPTNTLQKIILPF